MDPGRTPDGHWMDPGRTPDDGESSLLPGEVGGGPGHLELAGEPAILHLGPELGLAGGGRGLVRRGGGSLDQLPDVAEGPRPASPRRRC